MKEILRKCKIELFCYIATGIALGYAFVGLYKLFSNL